MESHKPTQAAAIIFDMDGLMLDTEALAREAWFETMRKFGVALTDDVYLRVLGTTGAHTRQIFVEAYGVDIPIDEMYAHKQAYIDRALTLGRIRTKPGLIDLLDWLDEHGLKKAVGSSTARYLVTLKLSVVGLLDRFSVIVCGDEVERGKPAPDIFLRCATLLYTLPEACIVLEDSDNGVRAATTAGMRCIMVPDLKRPDEDVARLTLGVVQTLTDAKSMLSALMAGGSHGVSDGSGPAH